MIESRHKYLVLYHATYGEITHSILETDHIVMHEISMLKHLQFQQAHTSKIFPMFDWLLKLFVIDLTNS